MEFKKKDYGTFLIDGNFGVGKSLNLTSALYNAKKKYNALIIYNNPYPWVDLCFSTPSDLFKIINFLLKNVFYKNNDLKVLKTKYPPIIFGIDEAHIYFFSDEWKKNFNSDVRMFFTQPRKRNVLIPVVSQRYGFITKKIRDLFSYIIRPYNILNLYRFTRRIEILNPDDLDLMNNEQKGIKWDFMDGLFDDILDGTFSFAIDDEIRKYKVLTNYIIGINDLVDTLSLQSFLNKYNNYEEKKSFFSEQYQKIKFLYSKK